MSRQLLAGIVIIVSVLFASFFYYFYQVCYTPNLRRDKSSKVLMVPKGADFKQVLDSLEAGQFLDDKLSFSFLAKLTGLQDKVIPGAYNVPMNCTNKDLIWRMKKGRQTPIKFTFNNLRRKEDLVKSIDPKLEASASEISSFLNNPDSCRLLGFDTTTIVAMFIPNTYELYYTTSVGKFMRRMQTEYQKFWTEERKAKAKELHLNQIEVSILASIVECETKKADEMPTVAGVYYNRLQDKMKLGADPTVVFAAGDFTIKRVMEGTIKRNADSPYNTYTHYGLPPGPIYLPSTIAINATLNLQRHKYYFFCAKEDFSGYHNFANNYDEHKQNAAKYASALNAKGIL